ncbi:MAG: nucleotidyltransferase family protein [Vicingaceae bacterium]
MDGSINTDLKYLSAILSPYSSKVALDQSVNWEKQIELARQHRISPLLSRQIAANKLQIPPGSQEKLKEQQKATHLKMLTLSRELVLVSQQFELQNIKFINLKGPVQSLQIFGDVAVKHSRDLDLLIEEDKVENCIEVLQSMGYETPSFYLSLNPKQKHYFLKTQNQLLFFQSERKVQIEIHWRLFANQKLLHFPFEELWKKSETVSLAGTQLKGLSQLYMCLYLSTHGAKHQWSTLYWLAELVYLIKNMPFNITEIHLEAKRYGVERPFLQFVGLAQLLFKMKVPDPIEALLSKNSQARLMNLALKRLQDNTSSFKNKKVSTYAISSSYRMKLKKGLWYKLGAINLISINDFQLLKLPASLFFLYYPLRPFLWVKRYLLK